MRVLPILLAGCLLAASLAQLPAVSCLQSADAEDADQIPAGGAESEVPDQDQPEAAIDEKDVAVLTKSNFDEAIKSHNYSLVSEWFVEGCACVHGALLLCHHADNSDISLVPFLVQVEFYAPWCGHCKVSILPRLLYLRSSINYEIVYCTSMQMSGPQTRNHMALLTSGPGYSVQTLAPHYAKAATTLKQHDPSILMAKVRTFQDRG